METSNMKNIVVLKNLPSNIVEEAIVILKGNKKIKKLELADKKNSKNVQNEELKNKEYILKEAEMLFSNYIDVIKQYLQDSLDVLAYINTFTKNDTIIYNRMFSKLNLALRKVCLVDKITYKNFKKI